GAHAMTDVTGFGLIGHALEIAEHSKVRLTLRASELPLLPGALGYAEAGIEFGGYGRNRHQLGPRVELGEGLSDATRRILFDPQTSGGLLISLAPAEAETVVAALKADGYRAAIVGSAGEGAGLVIEP